MFAQRSVKLTYYLVLFCVYIQIINGEGERCTTNDGKRGTCKFYDNCLNHGALYAENVEPKVCGFANGEAIICCPGPEMSKAEQKCEEYSRIRCSEEGVRSVSTIYNGTEVQSVLEYPHQVHIGYERFENPTYLCGGTLISEQWVLTAAHCCKTTRGKPVAIALGFLNTENRNAYGTYQKRRVEKIIIHPERQNTKYHDIALIKLTEPVQLSKSAVPACLQNTFSIPTSQAIATGWGKLEFGTNAELSKKLMKVTLKLTDHESCQKEYKNQINRNFFGIKEETQFCAGEPGKDACEGDSGGPLQIWHSNFCMHRVIGITSFGVNCGAKRGVYTRISHYIPWIENIVWP